MSHHFLIVDDSMVARMMLKNVLIGTGARITETGDGESALAILQQTTGIDAVFLDITMPGLGGIEVLQRIKLKNPDLPVVMVTADIQVRTIKQAMEAGAVDVIRKKIDPQTILAMVDRLFKPEVQS